MANLFVQAEQHFHLQEWIIPRPRCLWVNFQDIDEYFLKLHKGFSQYRQYKEEALDLWNCHGHVGLAQTSALSYFHQYLQPLQNAHIAWAIAISFYLAAYTRFQSIVVSLLNTSAFSNIDERSDISQPGQAQWFAWEIG